MAVFSRADKRRQVQAVLDEMARSIEHLPRPVLLKMVPALNQAHQELERDIRRWLARHQGSTLFTTQRYRSALVAVRHSVEKARRRLGPVVSDALWTGAEGAGRLATHHLVAELEKFGKIFEGTIQPVSLDAAAAITKGDSLLWRRFYVSSGRYAGTIGQALVQELAVSRIRAETISELTTRLQRRLPEVFAHDRASAARLARTETMSAYSTYHLEGLKIINEDDPEIVARWDASFDFRRCPMCRSLDGQVRNVAKGELFEADWYTPRSKRARARGGAGMVRHHKTLKGPPAHPNCRCVPTPWRADWGEVSRGGARPGKQAKIHHEATEA